MTATDLTPGTPDSPSGMRAPAIGAYRIDPARSTVAFRTRHLFGLARVKGSFSIRRGLVEVTDPAGESRVQVEIDAASFHTGNGHRDGDVRSAKFLDTGRHPSMTFAARRLERGAEGAALVGTLTVKGVERPVRLAIDRCARNGDPRGFVASASARIDRTEFGITASRGMAGRYLDLSIEVVGVPR
jgi:polyisoprenoid-binding protein YceI